MEQVILEIIFEWIIKKITSFFCEIGMKVYKSWKRGREKSPSPTINRIIELEKYSPLAPDPYLLLVDFRGLLLAVSKAPKSYRLYILFPQNTLQKHTILDEPYPVSCFSSVPHFFERLVEDPEVLRLFETF